MYNHPPAGFNAAILTRSKLNPASPPKEHNITRSVAVLSSLSVYSGVKQGIYCLNLFKGFKTTALLTHHPDLYSLHSNHIDSSHKTYGKTWLFLQKCINMDS